MERHLRPMHLAWYWIITNDYVNSRTTGIQTIKGVNTSSIVTTESYAGNIKAMSWFSKKPAAVVNPTDAPTAYVFNYDDKYQFTEVP